MEAPHLETLHQKHKDDNDVRVLIIEVNEDKETGTGWAGGHNLTFPVLLDNEGTVSASFAPEGLLPDLPRDQVPIGSNLIIDRQGRIQFYTLLDTKNFDAKLVALREKLYSLIAAEGNDLGIEEEPALTPAIALIEPEAVTLKIGGNAVAAIAIAIKEGFHVLADAGEEKTLIPLRIELTANDHIIVGEISYPDSEPLDLHGLDIPLRVYSGEVATTVSLSAAPDGMAWEGVLEGELFYQSCNDRSCFPPSSLKLSIPIKIVE